VLAVDPGNFGAFTLYNISTRKIHAIWDMPLKIGKIYPEGVATVVDLAKSIASAQLIAVVENVNSRPRQAHAFSFGLGVGVVHGCLAAHNIPFTLLQPAQWKQGYGLWRMNDEDQASTKTRARELAMKLFPENAEMFRLVKWDGRAESALIARHFAAEAVAKAQQRNEMLS
jgi:hypothetical protein